MPTTDPIEDLRTAIVDAAATLGDGPRVASAKLERPPRPDFGDYSTNAAMLLAPALGDQPRAVAERLGAALKESLGDDVDRIEVAGPGFLNLFMSDAWYRRVLAEMYGDEAWGGGRAKPAERVLVEFVSANPTGPITVASGRHAAFGDSLARLLEFAGHAVEREFYVNDAGNQIRRFGESIHARARGEEPPDDGYRGEYVIELAQRIPGAADGDPQQLAQQGVELMLEGVRDTLARFRVEMDDYFSERTLHESGAIEAALDRLRASGLVFETEGATWMRTSELGDDKDRVVRASSGEVTYFGADIAYHETKLARGFERAINLLGADHHGYRARILGAWKALGGDPERFEVIIMQLVNLTEGGQRKQMSKRAGAIVTLDDLIEDIGVDAARFFLVMRSHDTTLDLDLTLAREHSQENPVYYVQYAHARIASILRRAEAEPDPSAPAHEDLHPSAKDLMKALLEYPAEIDSAVELRAPHRLTTYARELSQQFSAFYRDCKVVGVPEEPFRLALSVQAQRVIAQSLELLGVSAPQ
ncbi:MAG TPA: arginine--tRNA ligase, partial [Thermoleophilaceae bacterium]|nr:arginine--tRNA ligase [Thermoleophilaceae bacterium]